MHILQMFDKIRQMIIEKFELRCKSSNKMKGRIIPAITKALNVQSKNIMNHEVLMFGNGTTEVTVAPIRHAVNLGEKRCSCRAWQVCEKSCTHALDTIAKVSGKVNMEDFVHNYFSFEKFRKAYEDTFKPITSQEQWPLVDLGYKLKKVKLSRKPGRPRVSRIKASDELVNKKKYNAISAMN
jgi:hypothetical protein